MSTTTSTKKHKVRLFLVRHGEAVANTEMRYLGLRDDPLTVRGVWEAQQVAQTLSTLSIAAVYSSPLQRTANTAKHIADTHGLSVQPEPRLREASFGTWEGLTRNEVLSRSEVDAEALTRWEADPSGAPPDGESLVSVQERTISFVETLLQPYDGQSVVVVSHVSPIKTLLCAAMRTPLTTMRHIFLDTATISVVDWGAQSVVRLFNAHQHLGWDAARWMK
ncbi:MAG: histidine phosphatase family protein [Chloroflexi bacterium AL-N10]|nr:histidine phosphatase family protein [Chloroflexi bacterium AL-N1]NOK69259.1 histidine phosphatase family protein [Chloroflexi bacterium AL-N10]